MRTDDTDPRAELPAASPTGPDHLPGSRPAARRTPGTPGTTDRAARDDDAVAPAAPPTERSTPAAVTATTDDELRADTPEEFLALLRTLRARSGVSAAVVGRRANIPRSQAYALVDPNRTTLPTRGWQVRDFVRACGLTDPQAHLVTDQWCRLRRWPQPDGTGPPPVAGTSESTAPTDRTIAERPCATPPAAGRRAWLRRHLGTAGRALGPLLNVVIIFLILRAQRPPHVFTTPVSTILWAVVVVLAVATLVALVVVPPRRRRSLGDNDGRRRDGTPRG